MPWTDRHTRLAEGTAVLLTAAGHLICQAASWPRMVYVVPAVLGWVAYVVWQVRADRSVLRRWGLQSDAPWISWGLPLGLAAVSTAAMTGWAATHGGVDLPWYVVFPLVLYPLWGIVQQLLVQGMVAGSLSEGRGWWSHPAVVTVIASVLFGLVHYPQPVLMGATFLLGLAITPMFLRWRNLWALGLVHGWLGTALYYLILDHDPWRAFFGIEGGAAALGLA